MLRGASHSYRLPTVRLSPREKEVLSLIRRGWRPREVAGALSISDKTVYSHLASVRRKLDIEAAPRSSRDSYAVYIWALIVKGAGLDA